MRYQTGMAVGHLPQRISVSCAIKHPEASSTDVPLNANSESTTNDRVEGEEDAAEDDGDDDDDVDDGDDDVEGGDDDDDEGELTEGEGTEPTDADIIMYGH